MQLNDKIKNPNPFKVPDGYFDTLTDRTMSAIRQNHEEEEAVRETRLYVEAEAPQEEAAGTGSGKVRSISFRPYLAFAAAILGFALLATVMVRLVTGDRASVGYETGIGLYADLAAEGLDTYFIEHELLQTEPVDLTGTEQTISSEVIIDYLMTEDINLNDIYELL
ncbi:MAG: hypothetical protein LC630_00290 [Bacteroidales bacterium]|nr:hypothetical protein [Bacteroidales bacterium]